MGSIKRNVMYQAFYEVLIIVLPFFTSPYISRLLGAGYLGIFSYTYSIAHYFQMFALLGIKFYGNRSIAQVRNDREKLNSTYSEIHTVHVFFSVIATISYLIYVGYFAEYKKYALIQGLIVIASIFDVSWLFFGLEQFRVTVFRNTLIKVGSVVCIFLFVKSTDDFWKYILIMAGSQFLSALFLAVMSLKYVSFKMPNLKKLSRHVKPLFVLFIPILALSLFKYMDKIMLGALGDKVELGYYENAERVLNIPLSIVFAFGSVMLPRASNMIANENNTEANKYLDLSMKYMVGLSIAMACGIAAIASVFAPVFWGNGFVKSGMLIKLLAISIPFSTVASIVRNQEMIPKGHDSYYSYSIISGAIINLIINYLLIPRFQAIGVTIGTIVAEMTVCFTELFFMRQSKNVLKASLKPLIFVPASFIMLFFVNSIGNYMGIHIYTLVVQVISGVVVFGVISLFVMTVTKDLETKEMIANSVGTIINKKVR